MRSSRSRRLFAEALKYIPGGVDSPVRAFGAVGGHPLFINHGKGPKIYDEDGNSFIDYVLSWGPLILGHAHRSVIRAIKEAADKGTSYGAPTEAETTLAKLITKDISSIELIRFVNSGTEATMSALRLARAFTRRDKIIKFAGCYHGHYDGLLVKAGSGLSTFGIPDSLGVPSSLARDTLVAPYNDLKSVKTLFDNNAGQVAAVIVEPVAANMGVVLPQPGFLEGLREMTRSAGSLLIFDEVITGFRLAYGGYQNICGIKPDLTCLGKIIGGGLPVGAYGGRKDIMELLSPLGGTYQAGTLSGNPLAMASGIATLKRLSRPGVYDSLEKKAALLEKGFDEVAKKAEVSWHINRIGSMMTCFFSPEPVLDYKTAMASDVKLYARYFWGMLNREIYLPPSQFEALFLSLSHKDKDIEKTVEAVADILREI